MKRTLAFLIFMSLSAIGGAKEYWTTYDPDTVPFIRPQAVDAYKGKVFVSSVRPSFSILSPTLFSSTDGKTWSPVGLEADGSIVTFCEHQGFLYGFATYLHLDNPSGRRLMVYRTSDGETWE